MIDEGEKLCQIDSPDGREALTRYLDAEYTEMVDKCAPMLKDSNLCEESEEKNEFQKCVKSSVRTIPNSRLAKLLPHIPEDRCKKVKCLSQHQGDVGGALGGSGEELPGTLSRRAVMAWPDIVLGNVDSKGILYVTVAGISIEVRVSSPNYISLPRIAGLSLAGSTSPQFLSVTLLFLPSALLLSTCPSGGDETNSPRPR